MRFISALNTLFSPFGNCAKPVGKHGLKYFYHVAVLTFLLPFFYGQSLNTGCIFHFAFLLHLLNIFTQFFSQFIRQAHQPVDDCKKVQNRLPVPVAAIQDTNQFDFLPVARFGAVAGLLRQEVGGCDQGKRIV